MTLRRELIGRVGSRRWRGIFAAVVIVLSMIGPAPADQVPAGILAPDQVSADAYRAIAASLYAMRGIPHQKDLPNVLIPKSVRARFDRPGFRYEGFALEGLAVASDRTVDAGDKAVGGVMVFESPAGRRATVSFVIAYAVDGEAILVRRVSLLDLPPRFPRVSLFIVPAGSADATDRARRNDYAGLIEDLRGGAVDPTSPPVGRKSYDVFAVVADRTAPDAVFDLRTGAAEPRKETRAVAANHYNFDGWHILRTTIEASLGAVPGKPIEVLYLPGSDVGEKRRRARVAIRFTTAPRRPRSNGMAGLTIDDGGAPADAVRALRAVVGPLYGKDVDDADVVLADDLIEKMDDPDRFDYAGFTAEATIKEHRGNGGGGRIVGSVIDAEDGFGRRASVAVEVGFRADADRVIHVESAARRLLGGASAVQLAVVPANPTTHAGLAESTGTYGALHAFVTQNAIRFDGSARLSTDPETYFVFVFQRDRQPAGGGVGITVSEPDDDEEYFDDETVYGSYDGWWVALIGGRFALGRERPIRVEVKTEGAGSRQDVVTIPPAPAHRFSTASRKSAAN